MAFKLNLQTTNLLCSSCGKIFKGSTNTDPILCPDCLEKQSDKELEEELSRKYENVIKPKLNIGIETENGTDPIYEPKTRISKIEYYLNIARDVSKRGTCLRRNFGAVIVKNDEVISTGYTGAPRYRKNCCEIGSCIRQKLNVPRGERYELCRSVHAEMNAIISAARKDMIDSTLYLYGEDATTGDPVENPAPCALCKRMIINAGIKEVIAFNPDMSKIKVIDVYNDYVMNDESLNGSKGY